MVSANTDMVLLLNRVVRPAWAGDQRDRIPMRPRTKSNCGSSDANVVPEAESPVSCGFFSYFDALKYEVDEHRSKCRVEHCGTHVGPNNQAGFGGDRRTATRRLMS